MSSAPPRISDRSAGFWPTWRGAASAWLVAVVSLSGLATAVAGSFGRHVPTDSRGCPLERQTFQPAGLALWAIACGLALAGLLTFLVVRRRRGATDGWVLGMVVVGCVAASTMPGLAFVLSREACVA